jgi:hypothetical protein
MDGQTAQIICPGPSLAGHIGKLPQADLRIGVNRAICAVPCDWWVFGDWIALRDFSPIGKPKIFTHSNVDEQLQRNVGPLHYYSIRMQVLDAVERVNQEDITTECPIPLNPCTWSLVSALIFTRWKMPVFLSRIDLYGVDWSGDQDWDGHKCSERNDYRWERERSDVMRTVQWLRENEIEVNGIPQ